MITSIRLFERTVSFRDCSASNALYAKDVCKIGKAIEVYEKVVGAKIDLDKSIGLQLCIWWGAMPSDSIVGRWTDGSIKLLGVWFGSDLQLEKNWSEATSKVASLVQTWSGRCLSLKGRVDVVNVFITSVITYRLTVLTCPDLWLIKMERLLSPLFEDGQ